jgi:hypothetical protein
MRIWLIPDRMILCLVNLSFDSDYRPSRFSCDLELCRAVLSWCRGRSRSEDPWIMREETGISGAFPIWTWNLREELQGGKHPELPWRSLELPCNERSTIATPYLRLKSV